MKISLIAELIINLSGNYTIDELEFFKKNDFISASEYMNYIQQERSLVSIRSSNRIPLPNPRRRPGSTLRKRTILTREEFEKRIAMERQIEQLEKQRFSEIHVPPRIVWDDDYDYSDPAVNNPKMPSQSLDEGPEFPGLWDPELEKNKENE